MNSSFKHQRGYSLLELSVVLVIISLVSGSALSLGITQLSKAQYETTYMRIAAIEDALLAFRKAKNRLPCPALPGAPTGSANSMKEVDTNGIGSGECAGNLATENTRIGAVPVQELGLPSEYLYDGWGQKFSYAVARSYTQTNAFTTNTISDLVERILIADTFYNSGHLSEFSTNNLYVIISHGPNGHGGYSRSGTRKSSSSTNVPELENCACDSNAAPVSHDIKRFYIGDLQQSGSSSTDNFDDIVIFKNRVQLANPDE